MLGYRSLFASASQNNFLLHAHSARAQIFIYYGEVLSVFSIQSIRAQAKLKRIGLRAKRCLVQLLVSLNKAQPFKIRRMHHTAKIGQTFGQIVFSVPDDRIGNQPESKICVQFDGANRGGLRVQIYWVFRTLQQPG